VGDDYCGVTGTSGKKKGTREDTKVTKLEKIQKKTLGGKVIKQHNPGHAILQIKEKEEISKKETL